MVQNQTLRIFDRLSCVINHLSKYLFHLGYTPSLNFFRHQRKQCKKKMKVGISLLFLCEFVYIFINFKPELYYTRQISYSQSVLRIV